MQKKTRCLVDASPDWNSYERFRQSENVCDFLSLHEAASDFSHYVMPT